LVWWVFDLCGWVELFGLFGWLKYGNKCGSDIEIDIEIKRERETKRETASLQGVVMIAIGKDAGKETTRQRRLCGMWYQSVGGWSSIKGGVVWPLRRLKV